MRRDTVLVGVLSLCLVSGPVAAGAPFPITPLVLEGDAVAGVGLVTRIDNLAVNSFGDWLVEVDTDLPNSDADTVLLLNGSLHLQENSGLPLPSGARINGFDAINLNVNGDSGWNLFLTGPPSSEDSGLYFNTTLVIQESDISTAPQFSPGTPYIGFFDAKLNDSNLMLLVASVDDPGVASSVDRALVRISVDAAGSLLSEQVVAKEADILPQQTNPIADFGTGPHQTAFNNAGQVLYFVDLAGPADVDGAIYRDDVLVAQEGDPSPVAGRNYEFLSGRGLDLNRHGQLVFKANIDGPTQNDEMLVRNAQVFVRERDTLPGLGLFTLTGFGVGSGPVRIDDHGNLLWYGAWNDPNTDVDSGLFLNELMLVQEGVTMIGGQPVDSIANGADAFAISDNGRYVVFEATLQNGTEGAFLIEILPPAAVPDGDVVPGTLMSAGRNPNGVDIDVSWDVTTCTAQDYHLLYGNLSDVSAYGYAGAACGLGTAGQATVSLPAGDAFWVIVAVDAMGFEGTHGFDGNAAPRPASAGGLCAVPAQVSGSSCSP